jgi:hypothetical protein
MRPCGAQAGYVSVEELEAIAATRGPGLSGSLMVGFHFAKGLALASGLPFLAVNHMEGHIFASFVEARPATPARPGAGDLRRPHPTDPDGATRAATGCWARPSTTPPARPSTRWPSCSGWDTPAGRRSPGQPWRGNPAAFAFPRGLKGREGFDFSFSGLKTAVLHFLRGSRPGLPAPATWPTSAPVSSRRWWTRWCTRHSAPWRDQRRPHPGAGRRSGRQCLPAAAVSARAAARGQPGAPGAAAGCLLHRQRRDDRPGRPWPPAARRDAAPGALDATPRYSLLDLDRDEGEVRR